MRKLICLTLFLVMTVCSFSALAEAPETFEFPGGITWGSTPEEVEAILGEGCQREDLVDEFITMTQLTLDHANCFGFACQRALFLFVDGHFWTGTCVYSADLLPEPRELADNLSPLYGMPEVHDETGSSKVVLSYVIVTWGKLLYSWELADGTEITFGDDGEEEEHRYLVTFVNTSVSEAVENALNAFFNAHTGE